MSLLDWIRDLWTAPVPERGFYVHPYKIVPETERPTQAPPKPSDARQGGLIPSTQCCTLFVGMKVVRQGPKPPPDARPFLAECRRCGSLLECQHEDVRIDDWWTSGYFWAGTAKVEDMPYVKCPVCDADITLPKNYEQYHAIEVS